MESRDQASARRGHCSGRTERSAAQATFVLILLLLISAFLHAPAAHAAFGFQALSLTFTEEDLSPATQAGSHPYAWTTSLALNTTGPPGEEVPDGALKDLRIQLPRGLVGTPGLLPHCSHADFLTQTCPAASEVGTIVLHINRAEAGEFLEAPLYNLEPLPGNAAELALTVQSVPIIIELQIATKPPHNLIASITNASQAALFYGSTLTIHGVPGEAPLLTLPRSCGAATATFEAASWQAPGAWVSAQPAEQPLFTGCGSLGFAPTLTVRATTPAAAAPSGLDLSLSLPNEGLTSSTGRANADLAAATLELPAAMTINPALAAGLGACSPAQLAAETPGSAPGEGCPQSAKIGTAEVTTPLLDSPVAGTIFVATPDDPATTLAGAENPLDARYALYLVLRDAERGVLITVPVRLDADPAAGRLTAAIAGLPQLPFTHFELHFNSGPRAPLLTPPCGSHAIAYRLAPSSGAAPATGADSLTTDRDCAAPPFGPRLSAGTLSNAAGSAAPLLIDLRSDPAEPNPAAVDLSLPSGLAADFAGVSTCPQTAAATAACPPDSRLGYARIAVGPGPEPLWIPEAGKGEAAVYLAGPHLSAPYSLLVRVPARAGPFDLGTAVLRAPIHIDPLSAQAAVHLGDLHQIMAGVPLRYRTLRLVLDRPGFVRNPTSCEPTAISGTATAINGESAPLSSRFQAADCAALRFKPRLALRLSGGLARNGHPSLRAVLRGDPAGAGIKSAVFTLPPGQLLDLHRVRALCARRLSPERCPRSSRLGRARLFSPSLDRPLAGPIYLREPTRGLPDLIADLHSGPLRILLRGHTAAPRGRLRIRLRALPDVPLSKAVITLAGGRRGILVNSEFLCSHQSRARATLSAHNGKRRLLSPRLRLRGRC